MSYAAELIAQAKNHQGVRTESAIAEMLGVPKSNLSSWKNGHGSPMPPERVLQLCDLAGIKDEATRGYWLHAIERDAVTVTSVRRALDAALDRLRPAAAVAGVLLLGSLHALPAEAAALTDAPSLHYAKLRAAVRRLARFLIGPVHDHGPAPVLA